jgi:hypothetical protein
VVIGWTSLTTSLVILGTAAVLVTFSCRARLRSFDALTRERAHALASRVAALQRLPIVAGVPPSVLE